MPVNYDKIKQLREKKGLTQQEAAERAGLHTAQNWNNVERGRRKNLTVETLEAIARVVGCRARDLLTEE